MDDSVMIYEVHGKVPLPYLCVQFIINSNVTYCPKNIIKKIIEMQNPDPTPSLKSQYIKTKDNQSQHFFALRLPHSSYLGPFLILKCFDAIAKRIHFKTFKF